MILRCLVLLAAIASLHAFEPTQLHWKIWVFNADGDTLWEGTLPSDQSSTVPFKDVSLAFTVPRREAWTPPGGTQQQRLVRDISVVGDPGASFKKETGGFESAVIGATWIPGKITDYGLQSVEIVTGNHKLKVLYRGE